MADGPNLRSKPMGQLYLPCPTLEFPPGHHAIFTDTLFRLPVDMFVGVSMYRAVIHHMCANHTGITSVTVFILRLLNRFFSITGTRLAITGL